MKTTITITKVLVALGLMVVVGTAQEVKTQEEIKVLCKDERALHLEAMNKMWNTKSTSEAQFFHREAERHQRKVREYCSQIATL